MPEPTLPSSYVSSLNPIQRQLLVELGVDFLWGESIAPDLQKAMGADTPERVSEKTEAKEAVSSVASPLSVEPKVAMATAETANVHANEARKMLQRARHRMPANTVSSTPETKVASTLKQGGALDRSELSALSWQELRAYSETCSACELSENRVLSVMADESQGRQCDWLFLEQLPSEGSENQGQADLAVEVDAGELFEQMLFALGLERSEISILPLLKCRPSNADTLKNDWLEACSPILLEQMTRLQPKCIVAFGDAAASLLQEDKGLLALRRSSLFFDHPVLGKIPVVATFSPQYLLLNNSEKAQTWQDLKRARQIIRE